MPRTDQVDRLESDILALVIHDLRSPLAVILGYANELRRHWDELPDAEKREGVDAIGRNGAKATRMVEEGLKAARAVSAGHPLESARLDLCAQVCELVADFAEISSNRFRVRGDPELPPVKCDPQRNWHILENLISNAIKFSAPRSQIDVAVVRRGDVAEVSVRDYGIGISAARTRSLFRSRAGSVDRRAVGVGIGLRLTRRIVEAQGGSIWVASRLGRGSTFTYTLPLASE